jgi:hypothetical protein
MSYGVLKERTWTQPDEQSVTIAAGGSGEVILSFGKPDGQIRVTIAQTSASLSTTALRHGSKGVLKASGDDANVLENATVDIFSNSGAYATGATDSNGTVTLNCTVADKWYAVAYHIFGNTLYMSEATEFTCKKIPSSERESVGTVDVGIKETATLPECQSRSFDASVATTLECTDGSTFAFPSAVLDSYGSTVTVNIDSVVTPFKANERPAFWLAKRVKATKDTGEEIIKLNGYVTITLPCDSTQLTKLGLALTDCKCKYNDPSLDAYKDVPCVQSSSKCEVTITTNHLTDFVITGNGNLKALDGTPEGVTPTSPGDTGSSATGGNSGSCGCRAGSGPVDLPTVLFGLLPFLPAVFLRRMFT